MGRNKSNPVDSIGVRFGALVVLDVHDRSVTASTQTPMLCKCDCGAEKVVSHGNLLKGNTRSCGCRRSTALFKHGLAGRDHSLRPNAYASWVAAKERCLSPGHVNFKHYGGRGIKMCDRWAKSFNAFFADMGERPDGFSLERIDVNGDYCPDNCVWIPLAAQRDNLRRTLRITVDGISKTVKEWASVLGIDPRTVRDWHYRSVAVKRIGQLLRDLGG